MTVIINSVEIERPIDEVFDYIADMRHELEWNPKVRQMDKITDGPIGLGTQFRAKWTKSPLLTVECTRYDRPYAVCLQNGGPIAVTLDVTLSATPGGGTLLMSRFDAAPHGLMKLLFPLMLGSLRKEEQRNMQFLKAALEKGAAAG